MEGLVSTTVAWPAPCLVMHHVHPYPFTSPNDCYHMWCDCHVIAMWFTNISGVAIGAPLRDPWVGQSQDLRDTGHLDISCLLHAACFHAASWLIGRKWKKSTKVFQASLSFWIFLNCQGCRGGCLGQRRVFALPRGLGRRCNGEPGLWASDLTVKWKWTVTPSTHLSAVGAIWCR